MASVNKLFDYGKISVYYDPLGQSGVVGRIKGPVTKSEPVGIVYMNWEKGEMTLPDGTTYIPEKVKYETKAYIVNVTDHIEAMKLIQRYEDNYFTQR